MISGENNILEIINKTHVINTGSIREVQSRLNCDLYHKF